MTRKTIPIDTYPRRDHYEHFLGMENPFFAANVKVDITDWYRTLKEKELPFFLSFQYAVVHAANQIPELRRRILGDQILEYSFCDPSFTVALPDGTYRYCLVHADQPYRDYLAEGIRKQEAARKEERLTEEGDVLSLLFISTLPWLSYESLQSPWSDRSFSNPSITWGRYSKESRPCLSGGVLTEKETVTVPVTLMVNHALVDGIHVARFFEALEKQLAAFPWEPGPLS